MIPLLTMHYFVDKNSIVRKIWGKSDTILLVFAGAAAEFALNKAVDWLYFTGRLPADPLGRLFSTVSYARRIVFSSEEEACKAIEMLRQIHGEVEKNRGFAIPDWAYRDVLYMLIHYSITAYELLEEKLSDEEKEEVYQVFFRLGSRMKLKDLPLSYSSWLPERVAHLEADLQKSNYTIDLFRQYKKHLGGFRYFLLVEGQKLVVPKQVSRLLGFGPVHLLLPVLTIYKASRLMKIDRLVRNLVLPSNYKLQIEQLNVPAT